MTNMKPCPFCGGRASLREELLKIYAQCDWCLSRSDESRSIAAVREAWNNRIRFDWFATLAMCQKWLNTGNELNIKTVEAYANNKALNETERLLLKATQCLAALCDGQGVSNDARMLRRELEQWTKEAMPF